MLGITNQIFKKLVYTGIFTSVFLACTAGKAMSTPDSNSIVVDDIEFYVETDKSIYYLGEKVQMLYRLTKLGFPPATIPCNRSPELNLVVRKDGETIWMMNCFWIWFSPGLDLLPRIPVEITSSWDMNDVNDVPVGPGTYDVLGVIYSGIGLPDAGVQITILSEPRTITVGLGAGYDFNTIQAAIDDSNDGDTIIVADGTYTGDGNRDIDFLGKAITLLSENGPENCIIDCNGTETEPHRGFNFHSNEDINSVLNGFTIINGHGLEEQFSSYMWSCGGGIYCIGSGPTITNCVIRNNSATQGGGIFAWENSSPRIADCSVSGNSSGVYCWRNSSLDIEDSIISGTGRRGIYCWDSPTVSMINCTISGNQLAGITCDGYGSSAINNCTIFDNEGSGIQALVLGTGTAIISNCVISGNNDSLDGGGISICTDEQGLATITNCTITGNSPSGVSCSRGNTIITNSITFNNVGGDIYVWNYPPPPCQDCTVKPTEVAVSYSCTGHIIVEEDPIFGDPNLILGNGNINADPCFADAVNCDYHLKSQAGRWDPESENWVKDDVTSPCIDAGNPGCPIGDEPAPNGNRRNMGAYGGTDEASKSPINWRSIADLTNDWVVDSNDLKVFIDYWLNTGECIPGDLNRNQSTNSADFALLANNWLRSSHGKSVFNFAVATKGPLHLNGNIEPEHGNISIESDVYIVSENSHLALKMIGNSHITGDVSIVNPFGTVDIQGGYASIGGETGEAALDHVHTGVDSITFPIPNPSYFEHYVVEDINLAETTFTNVRVPPNTNPIFGGGVTFYGVLFIETPNLVTFSGNVNITGIIVGDGDVTDDSGINRIDFLSTVNSNSVDTLPEEFGDLREETGTFLMAPGFSLSFNGDFETINGAIAANGVVFSGNAGGTINGSVLNYADTAMDLIGNNELYLNRFVNTEMPAGFE